MVDRLGNNPTSLARAAIESALKRQAETLRTMQNTAQSLGAPQAAQAPDAAFGEALKKGLNEVDASTRAAEQLHVEVVQGKLDFHEVAAQLKQSQLSFDFAMQIRNKLIDAYREVMRMSV